MVPFNPSFLLLNYGCHNCVDVVTTSLCQVFVQVRRVRTRVHACETCQERRAKSSSMERTIRTIRDHVVRYALDATPAGSALHAYLEGANNKVFPQTLPKSKNKTTMLNKQFRLYLIISKALRDTSINSHVEMFQMVPRGVTNKYIQGDDIPSTSR